VGSPKWHASPEFREHVFECEEPSCVRDVRDSAPLLRSLVRSLPSGAKRADGHSRGSARRAIHHYGACTRTSWDLYARVDDHRIVGTFARFSTAQQRILRSPAGVRLNERANAGAGRELKHKKTSPSDRSGNARPRSDHLQLAARHHTPMRTAYRRRLFPAGLVVRS